MLADENIPEPQVVPPAGRPDEPSGEPTEPVQPEAGPGAEAAPASASAEAASPPGAAAPGEAAPAAEPSLAKAAEGEPPRPPEPDKPTVMVRYGATGLVGRFVCMLEGWRRGQAVVVKSDRGQELGEIVCPCGPGCAGGAAEGRIVGEVLRAVTHADDVDSRHMHESEDREATFCRERIAERGLPMKLVEVEHLFGGDRIIFYFASEHRVDFRALVRDLAHEFQTRIEMRQIGARDEARLLGDYERCGRPLCCRAWIKELAPVSMRMAKTQKATLDPTKISGHCGRLMCCLRFEHETYRDLARNLPRRNTYVSTPDGAGKVVDADVVTQMVAVHLAGGKRIRVPVESILERDLDPRPFEEAEARRGAAAASRRKSSERAVAGRGERREAAAPPAASPAPEPAPGAPEPSGAPGEKPPRRRRGGRGRRRSRRHTPGQGPGDSGGAGPTPGPPDGAPPESHEGT